jgi:hypothetical protein
MSIASANIQETRRIYREAQVGGVKVLQDLLLGGGVVEPDGADVGRVGGVVRDFGGVEGFPAGRTTSVGWLSGGGAMLELLIGLIGYLLLLRA